MSLLPLNLGIKRKEFRANDASAKHADSIFETRRDAALRGAAYRCIRCGYESVAEAKDVKKSRLHVHHLDDDHHNNEPANLGPYCSLDHAYHHIGCDAPTTGGSLGWAGQMRIAFVPELAAEDLNHLQRACGAAMGNAIEREIALEIIDLLGVLAGPVKDVFGTYKSKDFAACFASMTEAQYEQRFEYIDGLRVLFSPAILQNVGQEMLEDARLLSINRWEGVANGLGLT